MPILNRDDAQEVERHVQDIFAARDDGRGNAVRRLFVEIMDFMPDFGRVSMADAPASVSLPGSAERVAALDGVRVFYAALDTRRVRRAEAVAAANSLARAMGEDMLIVFANGGASELHFVHPVFGGARPVLRRMVVERDMPRRTAVQQLSNIYWRIQDEAGDVRSALNSAFDVEPVTRHFFKEYDRVFNFAMRAVREARGARESESDAEDRRMFVQTLFNRLTFVYFLSRKGWLRFGGDTDYLRALWRSYQDADDGDGKNFYYDRLRPLFFGGLNNYRSRDITGGTATPALIGEVPFLNGGLFEYTELDERYRGSVPDEAFELALDGLFDKFNFTVTESTPFDVEVAVDPEMLGKMFEELVTKNERHGAGAYYTPRGVVSFMCREGLKSYLRRRVPSLDEEALARFVDERDAAAIPPIEAPAVGTALDEVTVVDPACGSGAYLLGMMQELVELRDALYNARQDPRSLYDLKLHVIQRSLYGADIAPFAVNIAMLRLWLSLSVDYEGEKPLPLPNLDFKIVRGDSLTSQDPSAAQSEMSTALIAASGLGELKGEYMRESDGARKDALKRDILSAEADLRRSLGGAAAPEGAVDWRVAFSEVFANKGGFDVAIANPPYVRYQETSADYKRALKPLYSKATVGQSDLYCYFYVRALELLRDGGTHIFVCSNSWLDVRYGAKLQEYLMGNAHVCTIYESAVERQFSTADINTIISVIEKTAPRDGDETRFVSLRGEFDVALSDTNRRREVIKRRRDLLDASLAPPDSRGRRKFVGDKWGAKYLRAPGIYHHVMNEYRTNLIRLGDVASAKRGIITGANAFFFLDDERIAEWGIEQEFLRPVMRTPQETRSLIVNPERLKHKAFICRVEKGILAGTAALEYIEWGESQGFHRKSAPAARKVWYRLPIKQASMGVNIFIGETARTVFTTRDTLFSDNFHAISSANVQREKICALMNSTFGQLVINLESRTNFGQGVLEIQTYEVEGLSIVNPDHLSGLDKAILSGADWDVLAPSRARLALDAAVFDALGLTVGEREAVYQAVRELVGNRLRRAGSA